MRAGVFALALSCGASWQRLLQAAGETRARAGGAAPGKRSVARRCCIAQNCAGCHGADGMNGPATTLGIPVYQALVDDATLRE